MSKNNTIKKSDKKYIRTQKAKIRAQFSDVKKQKEMIDALYERFIKKPKLDNEAVADGGNNKSEIRISKFETNPKSKIKKVTKK